MTLLRNLTGTSPSGDAPNVEDVFSTYLYTGDSSTRTITNGIDLAGEGGMVWIKGRDVARDHYLFDTLRPIGGGEEMLRPNLSDVAFAGTNNVTSFDATGFSLGAQSQTNFLNSTFASWTFRKAPRFFDVVTYTGNGTAGREIAHNLGVAPGMIIVKNTGTITNWQVYHRSISGSLVLQSTAAQDTTSAKYYFGDDTVVIPPTDTVFTVGGSYAGTQVNGATEEYVAYLFAHDPVGENNDGMIACGSYTGNSSADGPEIDLGWEPQYIMTKATDDASYWNIIDVLRGISTSSTQILQGNTSNIESAHTPAQVQVTPTGFKIINAGGAYNSTFNFIYMAIRGPMMKEPESATEVFAAQVYAGTGSGAVSALDTALSTDLFMVTSRSGVTNGAHIMSRLTGYPKLNDAYNALATHSNAVETNSDMWSFRRDYANNQDKFFAYQDIGGNWQTSGSTYAAYGFKRAKGFFDVVTYTGNQVAGRAIPHSLGVVPEMIWVKCRTTNPKGWAVYSQDLALNRYLYLNTDIASTSETLWVAGRPTDSIFYISDHGDVNGHFASSDYIAYLFASLEGVSKVGNYTGNGSSQNIACGFSGGARFVLIKRTDAVGDWFMWDTERGIVAGNDPHLSLNTTAAQVTTDDSIDPYSTGFTINQVTATNVNVTNGTYIFLAIA